MLMSTMSSLNISISIRKELVLMLMSRLSSLAHKLLYAYVYAYACVASEDRAVSIRMLIESIDQHLTTDAFSTRDPKNS